MTKCVRLLNVLHILVLSGVLLSGYSVQFLLHEQPCPLCMLQRLAMIGISVALLCNLKFGIKPFHYGLGILAAIFGGSVSARQMALHICPQFPTFGTPVFGLDLYWWAFIVFTASIFVIAIMLFLYTKEQEKPVPMNWVEKGVFVLIAAITLANVITTFLECGLSVCKG
jgi:magnesium-transporting ATPase (P-type)